MQRTIPLAVKRIIDEIIILQISRALHSILLRRIIMPLRTSLDSSLNGSLQSRSSKVYYSTHKRERERDKESTECYVNPHIDVYTTLVVQFKDLFTFMNSFFFFIIYRESRKVHFVPDVEHSCRNPGSLNTLNRSSLVAKTSDPIRRGKQIDTLLGSDPSFRGRPLRRGQ